MRELSLKFLQLKREVLLNFCCVSIEQKFTSAKKGKIHEGSPSKGAGSSALDQLVAGFDPPESFVDTVFLLKRLLGQRRQKKKNGH